ncbi:hypothetical protein EW146_g2337 [Bondarzewia mesenterica]|uniref:galacturonan 1,4-alpha-galacturonidase n=1 Tax=Bondarzewia mesenterica TaxID=1095465 RepID=A0A4S4M732_9AGAM|nr:hypothetical protein EW146_g2337 [Bondarzewia mesenterica]
MQLGCIVPARYMLLGVYFQIPRSALVQSPIRIGMTRLLHLAALGLALREFGVQGMRSTCTLEASGGDDAPAFVRAIRTCDTIVIPQHTTISVATRMDMTGVSNKHISVQGTVKFTDDIPYWTGSTFWILGGKNIILDGGGTLDGNGQAWYDSFASNSSLVRPIMLTILNGTDVMVQNIHEVNGPNWNNLVYQSKNIVYDNININAKSTSKNTAKNTDGWDTYRSDNVVIKNSVINNGDDCVSFKPNSTNILVTNLMCNGSHGISVGSLGQYAGVYDIVQNVASINITMSNAQNGARIKAWAGPGVGSGIVKNVTFQDFFETNVDNPIIIDQCYETSAEACAEFPSNTYIEDIWFDNISGTSSGSEKTVVASLSCSPDGRCGDINVNNITLSSTMTELTWKNWSITADNAKTKQQSDADSETGARKESMLRPAWQRAALSAFHLSVGAGLAAMIFVGRSRVIRRLHILPTNSPGVPGGKQLFFQGVHNWGATGTVLPLKNAHLFPGRDDTEVIFRLEGARGHWWIGLNGARINGEKVNAKRARDEMLVAWGIKKGSEVQDGIEGRWTAGPIMDNAW